MGVLEEPFIGIMDSSKEHNVWCRDIMLWIVWICEGYVMGKFVYKSL